MNVLGVVSVLFLAAVLVAGTSLAFWLENRDERREQLAASVARHPAGKRRHPGRPVDGEPLGEDDIAALIGCVVATCQAGGEV